MKAILIQERVLNDSVIWFVARSTAFYPGKENISVYSYDWLLYMGTFGGAREFSFLSQAFEFVKMMKFDDTVVLLNDAKNDIFP